MSKPVIRCAVYTRKSSEEGLDQDFNSLDAQAEACAAYIASQKHEGWKMLPTCYDDGGISGGTLDRPALQRLLTDIDAGRVDMVVVYKIDRLTRSLADFARLVERLEQSNCSFVSVTQAFNTSSSMGRLTLNVLLSFAQFEREVTAERIRDKIAASKKKGLWMGGLPPLGYDPHPDPTRRELVVNAAEAEVVRQVFDLYLQHGCLSRAAQAAGSLGLKSKRHVFASGRTQGGIAFSRGQIHHMLTNPVYRGLIRHKDKCWPGIHPAIIDPVLWDKVQEKLQAASARRRGTRVHTQFRGGTSAPLLGKVRDETGDLLTPTHTQARGRRFRYYVSNRLVSGAPDPTGWRLPAAAFEAAVATAIAGHLEAQAERHSVLQDGSAPDRMNATRKTTALASTLRTGGVSVISGAIATATVGKDHLGITLDRSALARQLDLAADDLDSDLLRFEAPFRCRRRGVGMKIVAGARQPAADPSMIRALRTSHRWAQLLKSGIPLKDIADRERVSVSYITRLLPLSTLSPGLQDAIVTGTQPPTLTLETLVRSRLPLDWSAQEQLLRLDA